MAGHDNIPTLAEQVSRVPTQPGCYLWKDAKGDVIYVGKAKNLRARMRQYVTLQDERQKIPLMMQLVASFDYIVGGDRARGVGARAQFDWSVPSVL